MYSQTSMVKTPCLVIVLNGSKGVKNVTSKFIQYFQNFYVKAHFT